MMHISRYIVLISVILLLVDNVSYSQESVFTGLKSDLMRADRYYDIGGYKNALQLYLSAEKKKKGGELINLKIGRTYYHLKDYRNSSKWYSRELKAGNKLPDSDLFNYAEALSCSGHYKQAITYYKQYQQVKPEEAAVIEKIWRLTNLEALLEDSIYYSVKPTDIDFTTAKSCPTYYNNGIVYMADKNEVGGVKLVDGVNNAPFKTLYYTRIEEDSLNASIAIKYTETTEFGKGLTSKYNTGPVTFFPGGKKMVFTRNGEYEKNTGSKLELFIAEKLDGNWRITAPLPFNSTLYSVSSPALNSDASALYFVSDMPGGYGKNDLYVSYFKNNKWSKPINLGEKINTREDEEYPFIHKSMLYFSSNGHSGLGGLDIYKTDTTEIFSNKTDIKNLGYPINSSFDDFGISLNKAGTRGYISSNRLAGGYNDNIYEIELDLQSYPLTIHGKIKYKELEWRESNREELLKNAKLLLYDNRKQVQAGVSQTDSLGNFLLDIPYLSDYSVKITSPIVGEITVKLEIPKNNKPGSEHDIVIVKNRIDRNND